jgi:hypothetical protein
MMQITESAPFYTVGKTPYAWTLNKAELQKCSLLIGGPCQDCTIKHTTAKSDKELMQLMSLLGIRGAFSDFGNESCVPRGRNHMAAQCQQMGFTHFLSRDADLEYNPMDPIKMMAMNVGISVVIYPKKGINWTKCFLYAQEHQKRLQNLKPEDLAIELEAHSLDYVLTVPKNPAKCNGGIEVTEAGDGFMMVKAKAFRRMAEMGMSPKMNNPHHAELKEFYYGHFNEMVVAGNHLTCDYAIEHRWRQCGGKVYALPVGKLNHMGSYNFKGGMPLAGL